jgi:metal-responsive CopG/Arc/MetJ family transcriptional regulator
VATIQVVLDEELLELADKLAGQRKMNRSALIRDALRAYLKRAHFEELERQERLAYERQPDNLDDARRWERVADWPDD